MRLSTRTRYGTRLLIELALQPGNPLPLRDIARRQKIPLAYMGHLIAPLVAAGIVKSARGAGGGVWLGRPLRGIRLSEVLRLLEGGPLLVTCVGNPEACPHSDSCVTRDVWDEVGRAINRVLDSTTLADMVERYRRKRLAGETAEYPCALSGTDVPEGRKSRRYQVEVGNAGGKG